MCVNDSGKDAHVSVYLSEGLTYVIEDDGESGICVENDKIGTALQEVQSDVSHTEMFGGPVDDGRVAGETSPMLSAVQAPDDGTTDMGHHQSVGPSENTDIQVPNLEQANAVPCVTSLLPDMGPLVDVAEEVIYDTTMSDQAGYDMNVAKDVAEAVIYDTKMSDQAAYDMNVANNDVKDSNICMESLSDGDMMDADIFAKPVSDVFAQRVSDVHDGTGSREECHMQDHTASEIQEDEKVEDTTSDGSVTNSLGDVTEDILNNDIIAGQTVNIEHDDKANDGKDEVSDKARYHMKNHDIDQGSASTRSVMSSVGDMVNTTAACEESQQMLADTVDSAVVQQESEVDEPRTKSDDVRIGENRGSAEVIQEQSREVADVEKENVKTAVNDTIVVSDGAVQEHVSMIGNDSEDVKTSPDEAMSRKKRGKLDADVWEGPWLEEAFAGTEANLMWLERARQDYEKQMSPASSVVGAAGQIPNSGGDGADGGSGIDAGDLLDEVRSDEKVVLGLNTCGKPVVSNMSMSITLVK